VDELVLSEGVESQNLSSFTIAASSVDEYLLSSPRRKIPGSGGNQTNSRLRWRSEKFKDQVEVRKIQGSGGPNSSSFCHHPK
jgi:hypothetical protein